MRDGVGSRDGAVEVEKRRARRPAEDSNPAPRDPREPALAITSDIASWSASSSETNTASGRERASAPAPNVSIALRSSASDPSFGALVALMASNSDFGAPATHASIQAWAEGANGSGSGASRGLPFTAKSTAADARDLIVFTAAASGFTREDVESGGWFESSSLDASDSPEGAVTEARKARHRRWRRKRLGRRRVSALSQRCAQILR